MPGRSMGNGVGSGRSGMTNDSRRALRWLSSVARTYQRFPSSAASAISTPRATAAPSASRVRSAGDRDEPSERTPARTSASAIRSGPATGFRAPPIAATARMTLSSTGFQTSRTNRNSSSAVSPVSLSGTSGNTTICSRSYRSGSRYSSRSANRAVFSKNRRWTVPTGPFRCFATMISAIPRRSVSGS